jgi:hypothetical protein
MAMSTANQDALRNAITAAKFHVSSMEDTAIGITVDGMPKNVQAVRLTVYLESDNVAVATSQATN